MKSLIWKEWREQRPIFFAGVFVSLLLPGLIVTVVAASGRTTPWVDIADLSLGVFYLIVWPIVALAAGSATVAGEVADGSMPFLLSRPVSRSTIWLVKAALAVGNLLATVVVGYGLVWVLSLGSTRALPTLLRWTYPEPGAHGLDWLGVWGVPGATVAGLGFALLLSVLMRRTVTVFVVSAGLTVFVYVSVFAAWSWLDVVPRWSAWRLMWPLLLAGALASSVGAATFVRAELFGSRSTLRRALVAGAVATGGFLLALGSAQGWDARMPGEATIYTDLHAAQGRLAVVVARPDRASRSVRVLDTEGRVTAASERLADRPAVSPDGQWVAHVSRGGFSVRDLAGLAGEVVALRTDGSEVRVLGIPGDSPVGGASVLAFSPDGRSVVLRTRSAVHVLDLEGGPGRVRPLSEACQLHGWRAGSRHLVAFCPASDSAPRRIVFIDADLDSATNDASWDLPEGWGRPRQRVRQSPVSTVAFYDRSRRGTDAVIRILDVVNRRIDSHALDAGYASVDALADVVVVASSAGLENEDGTTAGRPGEVAVAVLGAAGERRTIGHVPGYVADVTLAPGAHWAYVSALTGNRADGRLERRTYMLSIVDGELLELGTMAAEDTTEPAWLGGDRVAFLTREDPPSGPFVNWDQLLGRHWYRQVQILDLTTGARRTLLP